MSAEKKGSTGFQGRLMEVYQCLRQLWFSVNFKNIKNNLANKKLSRSFKNEKKQTCKISGYHKKLGLLLIFSPIILNDRRY